jgi:Ca2+-binding RTX toxin-like protein
MDTTSGDRIVAGDGFNIVLGDNGRILAAGAEAPRFGVIGLTLGLVETIDSLIGGSDEIVSGVGRDIVLGGIDADTILANSGETASRPDAGNLVIGDNGLIDWTAAERGGTLAGDDADASDIDRVSSIDPDDGGNDLITTGAGDDLVIGGEDGELVVDVEIAGVVTVARTVVADTTNGDTLVAGDGFNIVLGDNGLILAAGQDAPRFGSIGLTLGLVTTLAPSIGGNDVITTGIGRDVILGGTLNDTIVASAGETATVPDLDNFVIGDNGLVDYAALERAWVPRLAVDDADPSDVDRITTTDADLGGADDITTGAGADLVFGGAASDTVRAGGGDDLVVGDQGSMLGDGGAIIEVRLADAGRVTGRHDLATLHGGALTPALATSLVEADLLVLAGAYTSAGARQPASPGAWSSWPAWDTDVLLITLIEDGDDVLDGGGGDDALFGQRGDDTLTGGPGRDSLVGGVGHDSLDGGDDDDVVVGDLATQLTADGLFPDVLSALMLQDGVYGSGTTVVPLLASAPGLVEDALAMALHRLRYPLGWPADNALSQADGTALVVFATIVPELPRHLELVAGNDVVRGGAGDDLLVGDHQTALAGTFPVTTGSLASARAQTSDLRTIVDEWEDVLHALHVALTAAVDFGRLDGTVVVDRTLDVGNDTLDAGSGDDVVVGDDHRVLAIMLDVPASLVHEVHRLANDVLLTRHEMEAAAVALEAAEHHLRDQLVIVAGAQRVRQHIDRIRAGMDVIAGGDGNDLLVGDGWAPLAPSITVTGTSVPPAAPTEVWFDVTRSLHDHFGSHDHHAAQPLNHVHGTVDVADSDSATTLVYRDDEVITGDDVIDGGAGHDLVLGDAGLLDALHVAPAAGVPGAVFDAVDEEARAIVEDLAQINRHHHHGWRHDADRHLGDRTGVPGNGGNDTLLGSDGNDMLLGLGGTDVLRGGAGDDWLVGGNGSIPDMGGPDTIDPGTGADVFNLGDGDAPALRDAVRARLDVWADQSRAYGTAQSLVFWNPWQVQNTLDLDDVDDNDDRNSGLLVLRPGPIRPRIPGG